MQRKELVHYAVGIETERTSNFIFMVISGMIFILLLYSLQNGILQIEPMIL